MQRTLFLAAVVAAVLVPAAGSAGSRADSGSAPQAGDAMSPATLTVRTTRFGRMLFDGRGRALYAFTRDKRRGPSTCYGACAAAWPVYFARGRPVAGRGVKSSLIGTTRRRGGRLQLTYNGWPLYYYAHERAGQVLCQNVDQFGGLWLVVRPSGQLVR